MMHTIDKVYHDRQCLPNHKSDVGRHSQGHDQVNCEEDTKAGHKWLHWKGEFRGLEDNWKPNERRCHSKEANWKQNLIVFKSRDCLPTDNSQDQRGHSLSTVSPSKTPTQISNTMRAAIHLGSTGATPFNSGRSCVMQYLTHREHRA